jgi:phage terminase large subunit-like protein
LSKVGYQKVAIEEMQRRPWDVFPVRPTRDKRSRLRVAARYIKNGTVKFPRKGCEQLLTQLFGFGIEKHDDGVDALVYMILGAVSEGIEPQKVHYV